MSLATHRAALVALWRTVPGIGRVHEYQRHARTEGEFRAHYLHTLPDGTQQLRGWQLSNPAISERSPGVGRVLCGYTWVWRGYLAWDDAKATELTFDALVEAARSAFRADPTLGGVATAEAGPEDGLDGVQKADAGPVLFCGVLCHSAVLRLTTWDYAP